MAEPKFTPGPWEIATSCSWRRIVSAYGALVCEPIVQRGDNHPDLLFRNGGPEGPDARLIAAAPDSHEANKASLTVLCAIRDAQSWSANMLKDIDFAIEANRAALAKAAGRSDG